MWYVGYNRNLKKFSRYLRNHSTKAEIILWQRLRAGSMMGYTFNRQKALGRYIVDFYCKSLNPVIEVDEDYHNHATQKLKDNERQQILQSMNLNFLRFPDKDIFDRIDVALEIIRNYILAHEGMDPGMKIPVRRK